MPTGEFAQWLVTLGVGGILAAFMFVFYRKDVKQYTELWKQATEQLISIIKENTASNTKLISLIESQERNQIRIQDLEAVMDRRIRDHAISQGVRTGQRTERPAV